MKILALTTDGGWWIIRNDDNIDQGEFFERCLGATPDSFFLTDDENTYIQKCNIVAIKFEKGW